MAKIVHKMIVSVESNGNLTLSGLPMDPVTAMLLLTDINQAVVNFFQQEIAAGRVQIPDGVKQIISQRPAGAGLQ